MTNDIKKALDKDYSYPSVDDEDYQLKMYEKREIYVNRSGERKKINNYRELKKYRDSVCTDRVKNLQTHQSGIASIITPDTPYKGVLMFWEPGKGKTCGTIAVTELFKNMVTKYNTKIHILVPGRLLKESWKDEIIKCTKETYLKDYSQEMGYVAEEDKINAKKQARNNFSQYYKIMSHVGFTKRVLGQKIIDHVKDVESGKMNKQYKKTLQGDYERDITGDKIESLDNTLLVIDEAHHIVNNDYGLAVKRIIENSKNLRILLLTGTPMKNLADDIVELINFLRPSDSQIDRNLIFTSPTQNHLMDYKPGGREYLARMVRGYVSYVGGTDLFLYGKSIEMGSVPDKLMFTSVTQCEMEPFQEKIYLETVLHNDDPLDRKSTAVSNFAFPYFQDGKIIGKYGLDGLTALIQNIKTDKLALFEKLKQMGITGNELITVNENLKTIGGDILKINNLKHFSSKFTRCLNILDEMVNERSGLAFVYSNVVKIGIELFEQVLLYNGYLEYNPNEIYDLKDDTRHFLTGERYIDFKKNLRSGKFLPATFLTVTGGTEEESQIPEEKKIIIDSVFSNPGNVNGKYIKVILGSKVMTEGITLKNVSEIIILDVPYHLGQIMQINARGMRFCAHNAIATEENPYPEIRLHKLIVKVKNSDELTSEGILYQKAEHKYILVKDVERVLQENAIDCAINYNINTFTDGNNYVECIPPLEYKALKDKTGFKQCPVACNFQRCTYQCSGKKINLKYYDNNSKTYKKIKKADLDFTTFTTKMARNEINACKDKIKEMFCFKYVYHLNDIMDYIKGSLSDEQMDLFEEFFCFKAIDEFVLTSENEFNNFHDAIYDKFNVPGYLIYRSKFYIFQPLNQNENVPMYYRVNYTYDLLEELTLNQYFKNSLDSKITSEIEELTGITTNEYNFDAAMEYYDSKNEAKYVGIIDKPVARKKSVKGNLKDVFKIREKKKKDLAKKRGTGIPTLKGSVCETSKDKKYLIKIAKAIGLTDFSQNTRGDICDAIRIQMLYLEKYGIEQDGSKYTHVIIPVNHPEYIFPLNLEDRIQNIITQLGEKINEKIKVTKFDNGIFEGVRNKKYAKYEMSFQMKPEWKININFFISLGFKLYENTWKLTVE